MCAAGYDVINRILCRTPLDRDRFPAVHQTLAQYFTMLGAA